MGFSNVFFEILRFFLKLWFALFKMLSELDLCASAIAPTQAIFAVMLEKLEASKPDVTNTADIACMPQSWRTSEKRLS